MRYAICRILGDGQPPDGYYAAINAVLIPGVGIQAYHTIQQIGIDTSTGALLYPWCITASNLIPGATWGLISDNPDVDLLPDYALDAPFSGIDLPLRNATAAAMQARGIDTSFITAAMSYRDVIEHLGRMHEPLFSTDSFLP